MPVEVTTMAGMAAAARVVTAPVCRISACACGAVTDGSARGASQATRLPNLCDSSWRDQLAPPA